MNKKLIGGKFYKYIDANHVNIYRLIRYDEYLNEYTLVDLEYNTIEKIKNLEDNNDYIYLIPNGYIALSTITNIYNIKDILICFHKQEEAIPSVVCTNIYGKKHVIPVALTESDCPDRESFLGLLKADVINTDVFPIYIEDNYRDIYKHIFKNIKLKKYNNILKNIKTFHTTEDQYDYPLTLNMLFRKTNFMESIYNMLDIYSFPFIQITKDQINGDLLYLTDEQFNTIDSILLCGNRYFIMKYYKDLNLNKLDKKKYALLRFGGYAYDKALYIIIFNGRENKKSLKGKTLHDI